MPALLRTNRLAQLAGLLAVAAVIVVVAIVVSSGGSKKTPPPPASGGLSGVAQSHALLDGIPQSGITLGSAKAPVTIIEFADPQCPFCRDYTLSEMPAVVQKYVRTGKAKMELRLLTFIGPDSVTAGRALEAAGLQNRMWTATDILYHNQGAENSGYVTDAFLRQVLSAAGADPAKALSQAASPAVTQELGAAQTAASRYGVSSTPTILVGKTGGTPTKADSTAASIGALVDAALAHGK
jgi:protein-disulfide isomerase